MKLVKNICKTCMEKYRIDPTGSGSPTPAPWSEYDESLWKEHARVSCVYIPNDKFTVNMCTVKRVPEKCRYKVEQIVSQEDVV